MMGMGLAPIEALRRAGLTGALGTDGAASHNCQDMIETLKIAALWQKLALEDPTATTVAKALDMATIEGARAVGQADRIGSLEPGKQADLFILVPAAGQGDAGLRPHRQPGLLGGRRQRGHRRCRRAGAGG